jgi:hypothetical protein
MRPWSLTKVHEGLNARYVPDRTATAATEQATATGLIEATATNSECLPVSKEAKLEPCIYCHKLFDTRLGQGDHIIPASLGEFEGDQRFRGACPTCNNAIGRAEQQLPGAGPESFFRAIAKPHSRRTQKRGTSRAQGALGAPAPTFKADMGAYSLLVEPSIDDPRDVEPPDQLIVRDGHGQDHNIRLYPGIRASQIEQQVMLLGIGAVREVTLHCDIPESTSYMRTVSEVWPSMKANEMSDIPGGTQKVPIRGEFRVTVPYFQAIAKIGFHYYLMHSRRGYRGDEPHFAEVRQFILNGGAVSRFISRSDGGLRLPFGRQTDGRFTSPAGWCHILAADEAADEARAIVRLFVGPGHVPNPLCVRLGRIPNGLSVPGLVRLLGLPSLINVQRSQ